jgi:hypothetical protein
VQNWAAANGPDTLVVPPERAIQRTFEAIRHSMSKADFGIMEFCAVMRHLDRLDPSFRT